MTILAARHLEQGLLRAHPLHRTMCGLLRDHVLPPDIAALCDCHIRALGRQHVVVHQHSFDAVPLGLHLLHSCVHDALQCKNTTMLPDHLSCAIRMIPQASALQTSIAMGRLAFAEKPCMPHWNF